MPDRATVSLDRPREHVAVVTIDRGERMNAYSEELLSDLTLTLEELEVDDARAVVLTGSGRAFCAGVDLAESPVAPGMDFAEYEAALGMFQDVVRTLREMSTPVIAAVNGYAMGAGCDTALACDFRVAGESAVIAESFIDVGLVPGDGGAYLLPRLIGEARAKELIYTGKRLRGEEIVEWDLARECVPDDELLGRALDFAEELAAKPPITLGETKGLVNAAFDTTLDEAFERATRAQYVSSQTRDHEEAVAAFDEDREPEFEGR